ncbi:MAG: porin [Maricaulaceae bacterium]
MSAKVFWTIVITGSLGGALVSQAQVNSPFSSKKKRQAWETPETAPKPPVQPSVPTATPYTAPQPKTYGSVGGVTSQPSATYNNSYNQPTTSPTAYQGLTSQVSSSQIPSSYVPQNDAPPPPATTSPFAPKVQPTYQNPTYESQTYQPQLQQTQPYQGQTYQGPSNQSQGYQGQYNQGAQNQTYQGQQTRPRPKLSWKDRLGLGNIATSLKGFLKIGAAAVRNESDITGIDEWNDAYIADGQIRGEVSAVTQGGLEYGVGGLVRGQYDEFRRGFGGLVGDCPPGVTGCASVDVAGTPTAVRGHTSRFFTSGTSDADDFELALEGAYVFLRSSYGDISVGRDDGAAYLFSLGAPGLVAVNGSNSPVDYTGLDSVKTVNDASGFAEKITYVSPRLLGDRIGVGVQVGASYSLNARACGVDYCVRENGEDGTGSLAPDLDDVFEFGVSLDRTFGNGLKLEATGTYARASEQSVLAAFDDLESYGFGLRAEWNDFTLGGSWLESNNGLTDGDYSAYDIGLSWKPARWGASVTYGHAEDDNINLTSDQVTVGAVYDINDRFSFGTGVQYVDRSVPLAVGGVVTEEDERGIGIFVEGKVTF